MHRPVRRTCAGCFMRNCVTAYLEYAYAWSLTIKLRCYGIGGGLVSEIDAQLNRVRVGEEMRLALVKVGLEISG